MTGRLGSICTRPALHIDGRTAGISEWITRHVSRDDPTSPRRRRGSSTRSSATSERPLQNDITSSFRGTRLSGVASVTRSGSSHRITRCWRCGKDERQFRYHIFVKCEVWKPQSNEYGLNQKALQVEAPGLARFMRSSTRGPAKRPWPLFAKRRFVSSSRPPPARRKRRGRLRTEEVRIWRRGPDPTP